MRICYRILIILKRLLGGK